MVGLYGAGSVLIMVPVWSRGPRRHGS